MLILLALFLLSVAVRYPGLGQPPSEHQWSTAQSMITLLNWQTQGALKHSFCLIQTFPLNADKYVFSGWMRLMDGNGNGYYTGFPPFSIMLPYLVFNLLSVDFEVLNLRIFNLIGHLITTLFFFRMLRMGLPPHPNRDVAALVGGTFFIFLAPNLWFFSNYYSWDTFWIYLWVIAIYQTVRVLQQISDGKITTFSLCNLGLLNFFLVYSEYHGLLYSLSVILIALKRRQRSQQYLRMIALLLLTASLALLVTILQYSSINGLESFLRRLVRSGHRYSVFSAGAVDLVSLGRRYLKALGFVLVPLSLMSLIWAQLRSRNLSSAFTHNEKVLLGLALFPVVIHNIVFLQWSVIHRQAMLKSTVFLALIMAMLFNKIVLRVEGATVTKSLITILAAASLIGSIHTYNSMYSRSLYGDKFYRIGEMVRGNALETEVVFMVSEAKILPQITYHSRRNIQKIRDLESARVWLQRHGREEGIVYYVSADYAIHRFEHIGVNKVLESGPTPR